MYERNGNGVRIRADGKGDGWANAHRHELPERFHFNDFDGLIGKLTFAQNGQDTLFAEYVCDSYKNRDKTIRQFGYVALFDRKRSDFAANNSVLSTAVYLDACRKLSFGQPFPCRFFYVIGPNDGPWILSEKDINTGDTLADSNLCDGEWEQLWMALGLTASRNALEKWLRCLP